MNQKIVYLFIILFGLGSVKISIAGRMERVCAVSSEPSNNRGACRVSQYGDGDICYDFGSGPACSGTLIVSKEPPLILAP